MATEGLNLPIDFISSEANKVLQIIENSNNFLLSGGAGSGKTYSLVEILRIVTKFYPLVNVACITYTNAAVNEIKARVDQKNLYVSTIHEFLWANIKQFQSELKETIVDLINDEDQTRFTLLEGETANYQIFDNLEKGIQYKEYVKLSAGIISHDQLIILAGKMYEKYPKLCSITQDTYPFIFVDEYQDTNKIVIEILLNHLKGNPKKNIVGFFGDAMQAIYDDSIGNLDAYKEIEHSKIVEVKKEQNRRNPQLVITLANLLRSDGLTQHPSDDPLAPNMNSDGKVKNGKILFLHSSNDNLDTVRSYLGWDFSNSTQTKELNLTYNLIANKAGFPDFMRIYDGDRILEFVKRLKNYIKNNIGCIDTENKTFQDVMVELQQGKTGGQLNAVKPTNGMQLYIDAHQNIFQNALPLPFDELASIYIDKEQLIDGVKSNPEEAKKLNSNLDDLIIHLSKIQHTVHLYTNQNHNEFLRVTDYRIKSLQNKIELEQNIEKLIVVGDKTIGEIIEDADKYGIVKIDDFLIRFKTNKRYIYNQVCELKFKQFQKLYMYREGYTPFSTQHKTKGAEYSNVFVILDNGNWNSYNFEGLFTAQGTESVIKRTQKIFYVCCTRAKENLAVFYHNPSQPVLTKAREWFGEVNVINLDRTT